MGEITASRPPGLHAGLAATPRLPHGARLLPAEGSCGGTGTALGELGALGRSHPAPPKEQVPGQELSPAAMG